MEIPTGKIEFSSIAEEIYQSGLREKLFDEAYRKYPKYQEKQLYEAADHIMDGFEEVHGSKYQPKQWEEISSLLYEQIIEGLT